MKDPKDLDITKRIRILSYQIYQPSMTFPKFEIYEIGSQVRRATDSILLNFCEGNASIYPKTTIKFLDSTICSGHEVRAILDIILDRKYCF
jgi:four helix bundle protein